MADRLIKIGEIEAKGCLEGLFHIGDRSSGKFEAGGAEALDYFPCLSTIYLQFQAGGSPHVRALRSAT